MSFNSSSNSVSGILFFHVIYLFILRLYGILFTLENCMYTLLVYFQSHIDWNHRSNYNPENIATVYHFQSLELRPIHQL